MSIRNRICLTDECIKKLLPSFVNMLGVDYIIEISKKDWKLYQIKLAKWQENYIDRLNQEYITLLSDKEKAPSEKFWELEKRIKKDRRHPGVIIDVQKSTAIWTITDLIKMQVISRDDLEGFSSELVETVDFFLR